MQIETLTNKQIALMETVKNEWLNVLFGKRKRIDKKRAKELIEWLYELSSLQKPIVIFLESPLGLQYAQNMLRRIDMSQVWNQVRNQVWNQVRNQVENQVRNQVWNQVRNQVENQVRNQVENQVWNQVRNQVRNQVWNQVRNQGLIYENFSSYGNIWDLGWLSFYDFFERIGINYNNTAYNNFKELIQLGIYDMIQMDKICFVASLPKVLERDEHGNLHNEQGHAIKWRDGYGQHYLHGVFFDKKLWRKVVKKKLSFKDCMSIENMEQRMIALKYLGAEKLLDEAKAELVSKVRGYELYEVVRIFPTIQYFLKYTCPSTGRIYVSGIDPVIGNKKDAVEAMKWKFYLLDDDKEGGELFDYES